MELRACLAIMIPRCLLIPQGSRDPARSGTRGLSNSVLGQDGPWRQDGLPRSLHLGPGLTPREDLETRILNCAMALQAHAPSIAGPQPARMEAAPAQQAVFLGPPLPMHGTAKVEQGKSFVQTSWTLCRENTQILGGSQLSHSLISRFPGTDRMDGKSEEFP